MTANLTETALKTSTNEEPLALNEIYWPLQKKSVYIDY